MKNKKILKKSVPLVLTLLLGVGALSAQANEYVEIPLTEGPSSMLDFSENEGDSLFKKITGIVTAIETLEDGRCYIRLENEAGGETDFYIENSTILVDKDGLAAFEEIKKQEYITAYYVKPTMMTMIYPAQYTASVLALQGDSEYTIADVSLYDENLLNAEKDLIIHPSDNTAIIDQKGEKYEDSLENKALVVLYDIMALSYPAQTSPNTIIVLNDIPEPPSSPQAPQPMDKLEPEDFARMVIFVNGEYIENSSVYINEEGENLFPLRSIAEALGFEVKWDAESGKIVLGVAITLTPGTPEYTMGRMAPQQMSAAPVIIDGVTYVPGDFISTALQGQIDISQGIYNITSTENSTD